MEVKIIDLIDDNHQSHYWYGGKCAEIKYKGYTFLIEAIGDVYWDYTTDNDAFETFKDKNNSGRFYREMCCCLKNDNELYKAIEDGKLTFDYNNWWECFVIDPNGGFHDLMWDLDAWSLKEAIEEVKEKLDEMIKYIDDED